MSEALEALESMHTELEFLWRWVDRLRGGQPHDKPEENWKQYVGCMVNYPGSPMESGDWSREKMAAPIRAALEQKAEPVAWLWEHYGAHVTTSYDRAQQLIADGCYLQPLYTAPPSTAEAQARALEEFARKMRAQKDALLPLSTHAFAIEIAEEEALAEAKRIREEG